MKKKAVQRRSKNIQLNDTIGKGPQVLGEHKIIELMCKHYEPMPGVVIPFGDDVSALPISLQNQFVALSTDMLVAKTDVPFGMSLWQAARKAIVMNVSDFASKGISPTAALVALGLPRNLRNHDIIDIAKGLNSGARQYGAYIIGGDTNEADDLIISVHLYGTTNAQAMMLRKNAKPGDILAVTGPFGKTSSGLKILLNPDKYKITDSLLRMRLLESVYMPQARLAEGLALRDSQSASACMDSSDGLASSLHELAKQSNVGFSITNLPIAEETKQFAKINKLSAEELSLYGGEEYELVVTINPQLWNKAQVAVEKAGGKLYAIGKVTRAKQIILDLPDKKVPIHSTGWEHFKTTNI
ncbi:MAG: thiamine-phosphate kinase [Crenarchaeota archaeon]|nr:thiamine-phosphate kinase [Thermoproteota archaeon]